MLTLMVFPISGGLVSAHHSVAGYDQQKEVQLRGVVVEYKWKNPHVFVVWNVKDENGKVVQWIGEMNSPTSMIQVGMSSKSLKPGDEIILTINPSKTGNPLGVIRKITTPDGKLIVDRFTPQ
jgi:hypothetical protein